MSPLVTLADFRRMRALRAPSGQFREVFAALRALELPSSAATARNVATCTAVRVSATRRRVFAGVLRRGGGTP